MKKLEFTLKLLLKITVFLSIFIFSYFKISDIFIMHAGATKNIADSFYAQPKDTIDIVFFGTCHTYSTFMPLKIWDDFGFTSHVFASPAQNMAATYFYFAESVKEQHPKIAIVDVYAINREDTYIDIEDFQKNTINAFHNIPLSKEKIEYALEYDEEPNKLNLLLGLYVYHQRWDYQGGAPITYEQDVDYDNSSLQKGFQLFWNVEPLQNPDDLFQSIYGSNNTGKITKFDSESEYYLRQLLDKAREENVEVVLVVAPYSAEEVEMEKYNQVNKIADEYGVPFFNFNNTDFISSINILNKDMIDSGHVGYGGALKITDYIGEYINLNYTLTNKKKDTSFQSWNEDVSSFFDYAEIEQWQDLTLK